MDWSWWVVGVGFVGLIGTCEWVVLRALCACTCRWNVHLQGVPEIGEIG